MAAPRVLMVFGYPRSGSTVLGLLLHRRLGATYCGELKRFWKRYAASSECTCGQPLDECPRWSEVARRVLEAEDAPYTSVAEAAGVQGDERALHTPEHRPSYGVHLTHLYREAALVFDSSFLVDSSKGVRDPQLVHELAGIDAWFLYLVRDPRATAFSRARSRRQDRAAGAPTSRLQRVDAYGLARDGLAWSRTDRDALALLDGVPAERRMTLRYEDFVAGADETLDELARWLGLDVLPHDHEGPPPHIVAANQPLLKRDRGDAEIAPDRRWESALRPRERRLVGAVTGRGRRRHGYR